MVLIQLNDLFVCTLSSYHNYKTIVYVNHNDVHHIIFFMISVIYTFNHKESRTLSIFDNSISRAFAYLFLKLLISVAFKSFWSYIYISNRCTNVAFFIIIVRFSGSHNTLSQGFAEIHISNDEYADMLSERDIFVLKQVSKIEITSWGSAIGLKYSNPPLSRFLNFAAASISEDFTKSFMPSNLSMKVFQKPVRYFSKFSISV